MVRQAVGQPVAGAEPASELARVPVRRSRARRLARYCQAYPQLTVGVLVLAALVFVSVFAPLIAPYDPRELDTRALVQGPSAKHFFGTDTLGRDVFSRVLYGGRLSLFVGISAVTLGMLVGVTLGLISGYGGGLVDTAIMRVMDGMLAFPSLVLALTIAFALGASVQSVVIALAVVSIPSAARLARGQVLSLKHEEFIVAARALGVGPTRLMFRHYLPNLVSVLLIQVSLGAGAAIFAEASLSFLGLGVPPPAPSWGGMLRDGYIFLEVNPWLSFMPGAFIFLAILSFNFIGDGLRDALDPRQRQRVRR